MPAKKPQGWLNDNLNLSNEKLKFALNYNVMNPSFE